jgi:AcrR family transcriptional regulator
MVDDRRSALADAGLNVLATAGARGLTHRAVDRAAGIAEGSTSYYFRTRTALLRACADRLAAHTMDVIAAGESGQLTEAGLIELCVTAVHAWIADGGRPVLARHELLLESARDPSLREPIEMATGYVRSLVERRIAEMGLPDPADRTGDLVACLDGLALAFAVAGVVDREMVTRSVTRVMSGLLRQNDEKHDSRSVHGQKGSSR